MKKILIKFLTGLLSLIAQGEVVIFEKPSDEIREFKVEF